SLFPVDAGDRVAALVYAWGTVQGAAIELLAQVAGMVWSALANDEGTPAVASEEVAAAPELVTIAPAPTPTAAPPKPAATWESLPADEQQIHLRAQRFARVQVAEMR